MNFSDLMIQVSVLSVLGLGAGVLGGVIGFGTTIILMPALVHFYGPIQAIPVIAMVATVANLSRFMKKQCKSHWAFF